MRSSESKRRVSRVCVGLWRPAQAHRRGRTLGSSVGWQQGRRWMLRRRRRRCRQQCRSLCTLNEIHAPLSSWLNWNTNAKNERQRDSTR